MPRPRSPQHSPRRSDAASPPRSPGRGGERPKKLTSSVVQYYMAGRPRQQMSLEEKERCHESRARTIKQQVKQWKLAQRASLEQYMQGKAAAKEAGQQQSRERVAQRKAQEGGAAATTRLSRSQTLNNLAKEREHAEEEQRRAAKGLVPSSIQDALEMGYALYDAEIALLRKGNPLLQQSGSMPAQLSRAQTLNNLAKAREAAEEDEKRRMAGFIPIGLQRQIEHGLALYEDELLLLRSARDAELNAMGHVSVRIEASLSSGHALYREDLLELRKLRAAELKPGRASSRNLLRTSPPPVPPSAS